MKEPTEYEMLLTDEVGLLEDIAEVKSLLRGHQYELRKVRKALLKYKLLSVVHISDKLEKVEN